jgi:poly-gamma-glutamate synthesis protein (capsule biosynthesis protein)
MSLSRTPLGRWVASLQPITIFLCGDVMTGRGVDQVLPHPGDPRLQETLVKDAGRYVKLAERAHGPIPKPVDFAYIWGEALDELDRVGADVRIINLETAVTTSSDAWGGKGVHYRMNPDNVGCISAAEIDCCALANNHVLDWGYAGLDETLKTLHEAGVKTAGAGADRAAAETPAIMEIPDKGRVVVFSLGTVSSGVPRAWAAGDERPGVDLLHELDEAAVSRIAARVARLDGEADVVVASIHWGSNWGYEIPPEHRRFAHRLIDEAGVDVIHGHSSHHPRGIEVYRDRPILYGCGDFINDYEGISGYERYRDDLVLMYLVTMDAATGRLVECTMKPWLIRRFRLVPAPRQDAEWVRDILNREGRPLDTRVELDEAGTLTLRWERVESRATPASHTDTPR